MNDMNDQLSHSAPQTSREEPWHPLVTCLLLWCHHTTCGKKRNSQHGSSFRLFSWPDEDPLKKKSFIKHKSAETGMRKPYAANISMHIKIRPWQTIWLLSCTAQPFFFFFFPGGSLMLHQWIHISEACASQAHLLAVRQPLRTLIRFVFHRLRWLSPERP